MVAEWEEYFMVTAERAAQIRKWKDDHPAEVKAARKRYKERVKAAPEEYAPVPKRTDSRYHKFIGVDGEGYTEHAEDCPERTDPDGESMCKGCSHYYICLIIGDKALYTGKPLTTVECLDFITHQPKSRANEYVAFFFDYDVTMILRDMVLESPSVAYKLAMGIKPFGSFTKWRGFALDYLPHKHFTVRNLETGRQVTIHDTRGFFQMAFIKALNTFKVGTPAERDFIASMKAQRSSFNPEQAGEMIDYSIMECRLLSDLMGLIRDRFLECGLSAFPYEGPGPVAGRELTKHVSGPVRKKAIERQVPLHVRALAEKAYYGGRFEIAGHGHVDGRVWEYDIKSAYPDAMRHLPCLEHGEWEWGADGDLWIGEVSWNRPAEFASMGPLPVRNRHKEISFPAAGRGWYWSVEVPADADVIDAWSYIRTCDCDPFEFVPDMYNRRAEMEAVSKGSGIGLKLTLNSFYGKLAQRIGSAPHYYPEWAGLITAMTRAKIYSVYQAHQGKVIMFATDAVFTIEECPEIDQGSKLGQWELEGPFDDFTVFQPGVYFDGDKALMKTRGFPKKMFEQHVDEFRRMATELDGSVVLPMHNHLGIRQAFSYAGWRNGPEGVVEGKQYRWLRQVGNWIPQPRKVSTDATSKRLVDPLEYRDGVFWSRPHIGDPERYTVPYAGRTEASKTPDSRADEQWLDGLYDGDLD